jgi:hypothetical protein
MDLMVMMSLTTKNKIATVKKVVNKISIPEKNTIENSKSLFNLQIGKIILQIKKE